MEVLPHPRHLTLLPSRLSASERNPNAKTSFNLKLNHPILARLETCASMHHLKQIHAQMITTGLIHETFAASRLIAFCAFSLQGDLSYALDLFSGVESPNLFVWNAMIRAFSRSNHPEYCILFYIGMLQSGCVPDSYTFPFLLKACSHLSASGEGKQVHGHAVKTGLLSDSFVSNSLIHMYLEFGWIEVAQKLFDDMPETDGVAWATMIAGLVGKDLAAEALGLFCSKDWRNMRLDQVTLATVLTACAKLKDLRLGEEIHWYIKEENVEMSLILGNSLMNMYVKCGSLQTARTLFNDVPDKDLVSYNTLISASLENGHLEQSLELVLEMRAKDVQADEAIFLTLISACDRQDLGTAVHDLIRGSGLVSSPSICSALINMYSRFGCVEIGRQVFDETRERDVVTWNAMIAGYTRCGSMDTARYLFDQMPEKDNFSWSTMILGYVRDGLPNEAMDLYKELMAESRIKPDKVTILSALMACAHVGALEEGKSLHLYLVENGFDIDTAMGTALINMYAKCGYLEKSVQVFEHLAEKNVLVWTALISGFAIHGRGKEALHLFRQMIKDESAKPNSITFLCVLSACAHAGMVDHGRETYLSMSADYGIDPDVRHHGCMVDLLSRAGLLDEAADFIASLHEVDASTWGALLGASRIYGDTELGELAARRILEQEPMHDGAHILMSNIYAEAGRWDEAKEMRRKMKEDDITKEIGRSWIKVNDIRHEFMAGEISLVS